MAKIHIDRLINRYGLQPDKKEGWSGYSLRELTKQIIAQNVNNTQRRITEINKEKWTKALNKISTAEKRFIVPDVSEVLPARSVYIRKVAQNGDLISDTLRNALTKNLKNAMKQFTEITGEATYIRRRGIAAGTINPKLIKDFEKNIVGTFENYTKRDKKLGVPVNVHAISVTEMRGAINTIKKAYVDKLQQKNPELKFKKMWIHNRSLSKNPRLGHMDLNGTIIDYDKKFKVGVYKTIYGGFKRMFVRWEMMDHPHDPDASSENIIGCNCDYQILASRV